MEKIFGIGAYFWVGVTDLETPGKLRYIDDDSFVYNDFDNSTNHYKFTNISKTNPLFSYYPDPGHCVALRSWGMVNVNCSSKNYGLCEIKYLL